MVLGYPRMRVWEANRCCLAAFSSPMFPAGVVVHQQRWHSGQGDGKIPCLWSTVHDRQEPQGAWAIPTLAGCARTDSLLPRRTSLIMSLNSNETGVAAARRTPIRPGRSMTYSLSNRTETDQIRRRIAPSVYLDKVQSRRYYRLRSHGRNQRGSSLLLRN